MNHSGMQDAFICHPNIHSEIILIPVYAKASTGFSSDVDQMLMKAGHIESCPIRDTHFLLLLDDIHIKEDVVFDNHSGKLIGFIDLGDINTHFQQYEVSLLANSPPKPQLAKSMLVIMIRGLFTKLQFPYAQFPCTSLTGDQLYEAVRRIETCGFKVINFIVRISMIYFINTKKIL